MFAIGDQAWIAHIFIPRFIKLILTVEINLIYLNREIPYHLETDRQ